MKMEIEITSWLTKDLIKKALENGATNKILSVESIKIHMPIEKGNNYMSTIYRVETEYRVKNEKDLLKICLIIKTPSLNAGFISKLGVYEKEFIIYNELLPKYKLIFGEKWGDFTAKSFYSLKDNVLILEDLTSKGYVMANRIKQLNFQECKIALSNLAKFHAASVKLYETESELIKKAGQEVIFRDDVTCTTALSRIAFKSIIEICKIHPEFQKYVEPVQNFGENLWDIASEMIKPKEGNFNVLNHSDFWTANMMFKYIEGKPVDVIPIDFQISRYSSPAYDLLYFIHSSIQEDIRVEKYDELLNIYLEKLNVYLEIFDSKKRLDKKTLNNEIEEREYFAGYVVIVLLPIILADSNEGEIIEVFKEKTQEEMYNIENSNIILQYYKNENYLQLITKRFEEFDKKGWFLNRQYPNIKLKFRSNV